MVTMLKNKCSVWKRIKFPTFSYNCYYFTWSDTYFIQLETLLINHPSYFNKQRIMTYVIPNCAQGASRFFVPSRPAQRSTHPPTSWVPVRSRGKRPGRGVNHPPHPPYRVELYFYCPFVPSWQVVGWTWPSLFKQLVQATIQDEGGTQNEYTWSCQLSHGRYVIWCCRAATRHWI